METHQKQHNPDPIGEIRSYSVKPTQSVLDTRSILQTVQSVIHFSWFMMALLISDPFDRYRQIVTHYVYEMKMQVQSPSSWVNLGRKWGSSLIRSLPITEFRSALFAVVLATPAWLIPSGPSREVLRCLVSCSIVLNLTASALSSCTCWICSELPRTAMKLIPTNSISLPYEVVINGEMLPVDIISHRLRVLIKFYMHRNYMQAYNGSSIAFLFGNVFTALTGTTWIWIEQPHAVYSVLLVDLVPSLL
jgi:hypothetical protein